LQNLHLKKYKIVKELITYTRQKTALNKQMEGNSMIAG